MTLQSMTGFARVDGMLSNARWTWEIKSVNGKSLDVRWRLPNGLDFLERELRSKILKYIARGNLHVSLNYESDADDAIPALNEKAAEAVLQISSKLKSEKKLPPISIDGLLSVKGVLNYSDESALDEKSTALRNKHLLKTFEEAVKQLAQSRASEGTAIKTALDAQLDGLKKLFDLINKDESRTPKKIEKSLKEKISKVLESAKDMDEQRLYQEVAFLVTKADIQEELDRLSAHIASARELLDEKGAVGRRLDFLSQELNRECNTICSKSNAINVSKYGMEMKVIVDQFREQIQNIQ